MYIAMVFNFDHSRQSGMGRKDEESWARECPMDGWMDGWMDSCPMIHSPSHTASGWKRIIFVSFCTLSVESMQLFSLFCYSL